MDVKRIGSQPSGKGSAEYFTGTVRIDPLNSPPEPARVSMALVTFEPGARTAWHTHPLGQTLIVTAGCGLAQREGGAIEQIRPGGRNLPGRCDLVRAGGKTLARRNSHDRDEPYRHPGKAGRLARDMDGACQ